MAFPFWILAMLGAPIIDSLLGGQDNTTTQTTETPPQTPFDPAYSMLSPALMSLLAQNVNRLSGAGFPGGKGIGGDLMSDIIAQVSQAWPDIIAGYGGSAKADPSCTTKCNARYGPGQLSSDPAALADCIKTCNARGGTTPRVPA